jgi:DNA-binding transcriptional LysR family regulator
MSYVEAGAGIGIATESVVTPTPALHFVLLKPVQRVPLVFVWQEDDDSPPVQRFRELLLEWKRARKLWHGQSRLSRQYRRGADARTASGLVASAD